MEEHIQNIIPEYLTGELTHAGFEKAEKHIAECHVCAKEEEEIKRMLNMLDSLDSEEPSDNIFEKIIEDISNTIPEGKTLKRRPFSVKIFQIALGMVFLLIAVMVLNANLDLIINWDKIKVYWFANLIGSIGVSIGIVILVSLFFFLAIMPVLLFEQLKEKNI
jgi:hypothetical protein